MLSFKVAELLTANPVRFYGQVRTHWTDKDLKDRLGMTFYPELGLLIANLDGKVRVIPAANIVQVVPAPGELEDFIPGVTPKAAPVIETPAAESPGFFKKKSGKAKD